MTYYMSSVLEDVPERTQAEQTAVKGLMNGSY